MVGGSFSKSIQWGNTQENHIRSCLVPGVWIPVLIRLKLHKATRKAILFPAADFGGAFDGKSRCIIEAITTQLICAIVYLVTVELQVTAFSVVGVAENEVECCFVVNDFGFTL